MDGAALGTLISGIGGLFLGAFALLRSWKQEADRVALIRSTAAVQESSSASAVGLKYLQEALAALQKEAIRQEGRIGELLQRLKDAEQRHKSEMADLEARYRAEISQLKRRLEENE